MPQLSLFLEIKDTTNPDFNNLKLLLNKYTQGIYIVDHLRKIYFWNAAAEKITGFTEAEVKGKYCDDNILDHYDESGSNICKSSCPVIATMKTGHSVEKRVFLRRKMGNRIPVFVYTLPIKDKQDKIIGAIEMFSDTHNQETFINSIKPLLEELK